MERIFFSKNNYNLIYNLTGKHVYESIGIDIAKNIKYENEIKNIMKSVFTQKNNLNINFKNLNDLDCSNALSKKVLNIAINYFKNNENNENKYKNDNIKINNKKLHINQIERNNISNINIENKLDNRPIPSFVIEENDINKKYKELQNERTSILNNKPNTEPIFKDEIHEDNIDIKKKFQNISSEREEEFLNNPNNDENPINNAWNLNRNKITSSLEPENITNSEYKINTIDNQLLPSIDESNNIDLDSQFNLIMNNDLNDLKSKFENTSVKDRFNEFQNELTIDNSDLSENKLYEELPIKLSISPQKELLSNYENNLENKNKKNIKKKNTILLLIV